MLVWFGTWVSRRCSSLHQLPFIRGAAEVPVLPSYDSVQRNMLVSDGSSASGTAEMLFFSLFLAKDPCEVELFWLQQ